MNIVEVANEMLDQLKESVSDCGTDEEAREVLINMIHDTHDRLMQEEYCIECEYMRDLVNFLTEKSDEHNSTDPNDLSYLTQAYIGLSGLLQHAPDLMEEIGE